MLSHLYKYAERKPRLRTTSLFLFFFRTLQEPFSGIFPRDNPKNTRFAINFFTSIGLGGLTDELREHLKQAPKVIIVANHNSMFKLNHFL